MAISCINYEYYNSPKFRLFGGAPLDESIKNIKNVDSSQIPVKTLLSIGDILSTKKITELHKKAIPTKEEFEVIDKTKNLIKGLNLEDVELVDSLKFLDNEIQSVTTERDNLRSMKNKADSDLFLLKRNLNDKLSPYNISATKFRSISNLKERVQATKDELKNIELKYEEDVQPPNTEVQIPSTEKLSEIDALVKQLDDLDIDIVPTEQTPVKIIDATKEPEYLKVEGRLKTLEVQLEKEAPLLARIGDEELDNINELFFTIDEYSDLSTRIKAQYDAIELNINRTKNNIDSTKLETKKIEAASEFLDHLEVSELPNVMLKSGLPIGELNNMFKRALTVGDSGLHHLHIDGLNRAVNEITDIAHRVSRTFAPKDEIKFANITNSTEAALETIKHTTDALKKNRADVMSGHKGAQGLKTTDELLLENMDNNENLSGKPIFYPPPAEAIDNEILDSFVGFYNTTNLPGETYFDDKVLRNEIKNNLVKTDYDVTKLDDVLKVLDRENLSYIRANQLQITWATEKLSQAGDRTMQLTYNEKADPKFEKMVNRSLVEWMDTVNHLETKQQQVMESLNILKPAAKNSKNIKPEDYC